MNFNELTNPTNALHILDIAGLVRIPFNSINCTIKDMISVYAVDLLSATDYEAICSSVKSTTRLNTSASYFYIFKHSQYIPFLKLIAKENAIINGSITCTTESDVIYSTQEDGGYEECPVFTLADLNVFENIGSTVYHSKFAKDKIHLCKITTRRQSIGCKPVKLTEVCLFIPE